MIRCALRARPLRMKVTSSQSNHDWDLYSSRNTNYIITNEVPWIRPKYIYCLADSNTHKVFTMKTYIRLKETENALQELFQKNTSMFSVYDIKEGVILFENEEKAQIFSDRVEDDTVVVGIDSHGIFRELQDADAVGILFYEQSYVPNPEELQRDLMS